MAESSIAKKPNKKKPMIEMTVRSRIAVVLIANLALVIALIACFTVYNVQNKDDSYVDNVTSISSIASARAEIAAQVLAGESSNLAVVYDECHGANYSDALAFVETLTAADASQEFQLLTYNDAEEQYEGVSSKKVIGTSGPVNVEVSYQKGQYGRLFDSIDALRNDSDNTGKIGYSTEFTVGTEKQYAIYCKLHLAVPSIEAPDQRIEVPYYLLSVKPVDTILSTIKTTTVYSDLTAAVVSGDGYYLASGDGFKASNVFDYIAANNNLSDVDKRDAGATVKAAGSGESVLYYKNADSSDSVYAFAKLSENSDFFVVVSVPTNNFVSAQALDTLPIVSIVLLVILLVFDLVQFLLILNKLRISIENEKYANQAKTEFLSHMSHDIRTPLNSIINFSDFLLASNSLETAKKYGEKVNKSGRYLLSLINDTLSMSRIEAGNLVLKPEPMSFSEFEEGLMSILGEKAGEKNIDFKINGGNALNTDVLLDPARLQQVFVNLLNNAIKFTPDGGKVSLDVSADDLYNGILALRFVVKDTGRGMSKEFVEEGLFKTFSQEYVGNDIEEGGTGLGLSIAKSIVEAMNGKISCESQQGVGTTFTVLIPAPVISISSEEERKVVEQEKIEVSKSILKGCRVLICEDNTLNGEITTHLLDGVGCMSDLAENGKLGVEKYAESKEFYYDAVLMDRRMPVMDGIEATEQIRALIREDVKSIPIIALSADVFEEHIELGMSSGMVAYLSKPVEPKELYRVLSEKIAERREALKNANTADGENA